mgnify:CR=1 FL=1
MTKTSEMLKSVSIDDWKTYLNWHLIHTTDDKLSMEIEQEGFNFYGTILSGAKKMKPRWERVLGDINHNMGELLGQEYVKVAFSEEEPELITRIFADVFIVRLF